MERAAEKTKLLRQCRRRNEVSCADSRRVLIVPVVVEPIVVRAVRTVVPIAVADVEIAVAVAKACEAPPMPLSLPIECSRGCIVFVI